MSDVQFPALGARLKAARLAVIDPVTGRHLSQDEVARRLDVSRVTVVGWESGRHHPRARLGDLAAMYGTTSDSLLGMEQAPVAAPNLVLDPNAALRRRLSDFVPVKAVPVLRAVSADPMWMKKGLAGAQWEPIDSPVDYVLQVTDPAMAAGGLQVGECVFCRRLAKDEAPALGALAVVVTADRTVLRYIAPRDRLTKGPGEKPEPLPTGARIDAVAVKVERPAPALPE